MKDPVELQSCIFESREYLHGQKVCTADKCCVCNDGRWIEDRTVFVL